jgi:soluble lytic murein transglycosylase-like protein
VPNSTRNLAEQRTRLLLAASAAILAVAVLIAALSSGGPAPLPLPGIGKPARSGDPFAYISSRSADFSQRATAGNAHVLFAKSPGGVLATAARVAHWRPMIDAATAGTGIDPNLLEALVFLESAGNPNALAGPDAADAAGLTQILAQTGTALLGMHIDLAASRRLTGRIDSAYAAGNARLMAALQRRRAKIDDRFNPPKALAATVRYLKLAERSFGGRSDLAVVAYHMGIGNLQHVLTDYDGGDPVPYVQLYFDTAPDHHTAAFNLLSTLGDDSSLYWWRVLGSLAIMRMYRSDRSALASLVSLQGATDSNAEVLHPPAITPPFANPDALRAAYTGRELLPLPRNPARVGLAYAQSMGGLASKLGEPRALYRGLRAPALDLLIELGVRVQALSGSHAPLIVASTVTDGRYDQLAPGAAESGTGWSFQILRRYQSRAQADAFQAMLDRLQALNLIAWTRRARTIDITVAPDAARAIVNGP